MKKGNTIFFKNTPTIKSFAAICGSKEKEGIIGDFADITLDDDMFGESTYEKAECKMLTTAISTAIEKSGYKESDIDVLISGDLLNQIISASFAARDYTFPFLGVYSACSTMSESMMLALCINCVIVFSHEHLNHLLTSGSWQVECGLSTNLSTYPPLNSLIYHFPPLAISF